MKKEPETWLSRLVCQRHYYFKQERVFCDGEVWGTNDMHETEYKYTCPDKKCGWSEISTAYYR